jgi:hypothetical protein
MRDLSFLGVDDPFILTNADEKRVRGRQEVRKSSCRKGRP